MRKLIVFNNISLDGFFTDAKGDMSFARNEKPDAEWDAFVAGNASGTGGTLLFGRITYEMMASFWPTPAAVQSMPVVAERMNNFQKVVFSRTIDRAAWNNTRLVKGDLTGELHKMKQAPGENILIFGSGSLVSQLTEVGLIEEYQFVVIPVVLGNGRTMFDSIKEKLRLKLKSTRAFGNGNVVLYYEPIA